ncbi:S-crystallin SL11-like [Diadema antillarum]|uniref:S-crystallin SL11-like n=1 Tax=Diadema antillarum TaxID=105358 RepID=UPI003A89350C
MPSYKLTYFDARGRVEIARLMFALKGVEFDDVRVDYTTFATSEEKKKAPLGQLPILEIEGRPILPQSRAIQRYLAREFGFYGSNNKEATFMDLVVETYDDFTEGMSKFIYYESDPAKKAEAKKKFMEESAPRLLAFLEKLLGQSSSAYFVGDKASFADVTVFNLVDVGVDHLGEDLFSKYPKLVELKQRVSEIPSVKAYLDKRPKCQY